MRWKEVTREACGKIVKGVNTTCDVGVNQTSIEAAKFGNSVDQNGVPTAKLFEAVSDLSLFDRPDFYQCVDKAFSEFGETFRCTQIAEMVLWMMPGRTKVYGFSQAWNPTATFFNNPEEDEDEGHHFAVVDNRYIVDLWVKDMGASKAVFDITNPADAKEIAHYYGDQKKWVDITSEMSNFERLCPGIAQRVKDFVSQK